MDVGWWGGEVFGCSEEFLGARVCESHASEYLGGWLVFVMIVELESLVGSDGIKTSL